MVLFSSCSSINVSISFSTCPFGSSDFSTHSCLFKQSCLELRAQVRCWIHGTFIKVTGTWYAWVWLTEWKQKNPEKRVLWHGLKCFLKKHLLKQMLQYFSLIAIGPTINLPLTGFPEHIIVQEIQAYESFESKTGNNSKVEVRLLWRIPFVSDRRLKGAVCAAEVMKPSSLFPSKWCIFVFCSHLLLASNGCEVTLVLLCSDQSMKG